MSILDLESVVKSKSLLLVDSTTRPDGLVQSVNLGSAEWEGSLLLHKGIAVILSLSFIWAGRTVHCLEIAAAASAATHQQEYLPAAFPGGQSGVPG